VASADGVHIAYSSVDEGEVQKLTALGLTSWHERYGLDSNIVLLNTHDNSTITLTAGPIGAPSGTQTPTSALAMSEPSWSPDGKALAWIEAAPGNQHDDSRPMLVIYRPATASFARYPETMNGGLVQTFWGKTGIAVISIYNEGVGDLYLYDVNGKTLAHHVFGFNQSVGEVELHIHGAWLNVGAKEYFGSLSDPYMLDVLSDTLSQRQGTLQMVNPQAPDGLRVSYKPADLNGYAPSIQIRDANNKLIFDVNQNTVPYVVRDIRSVGIAPDGQHVAFIDTLPDHPRVMIYYQGLLTQAIDDTIAPAPSDDSEGIQGLAWGPVEWRVVH
jgi:hypothetical protein